MPAEVNTAKKYVGCYQCDPVLSDLVSYMDRREGYHHRGGRRRGRGRGRGRRRGGGR